jgi:lipopolysaccharide export system permease protein
MTLLKGEPPLDKLLIEYYLNFILFYGNLFSPLLIFISVIFFTSKMASRTEIVAILSSGVSFKRMLLPYFIGSVFLASLSLYLNHFLIPHANTVRIAFEEAYFKISFNNYDVNIHKQIGPGDYIYFEKYNARSNIGYKFSLEHWEEDELKFKLISDFTQWDSTKEKWTVHNYRMRYINGEEEEFFKGYRLDTTLNMHPSDFEQRLEYTTQMMNTFELNEFIEEEIEGGSENVPFHLIEKHQRTSIPFATFVLILIGVSISSRKVRGGIGAHLALGLFIAVTYIFAIKVSSVYATNTGLSPFWACWIPNILYGILSVYLFRQAPK